jgi:hypothetical protein
MPEDEASVDRGWLVEPVGPNDMRIHIDVGDGVELSEEAQAALDTLLAELQESEVAGFASIPPCPSLKACGDYMCNPLGKCSGLYKRPCFADVTCWILPIA